MKTTVQDGFTVESLERNVTFWHDHPFSVHLREGKLSREALKSWVANRYYYQKCIPLKDAAILANCDNSDVRRRWAARLLAQDGDAPGRGELAEWRQLAAAVGIADAELADDTLVVPGVRFAADSYVAFARGRSWLEGVAASITQGQAATHMAVRSASFERFYPWVDRQAVAHFSGRKDRLAREAEDARALLREFCRTPAQQELARAAVSFKSSVLWAILDALRQAHHASE